MQSKKRLLVGGVLVAALGLGLGGALASAEGPASLEGTWMGTAAITNPPGMPPFPSTDVYTANRRWPGHGTVVCTIPGSGKMPIFIDGQLAYFVKTLPTGSGSWVRTGRSTFAFTVWRILLNADTGAVAGMAKFWGSGGLESKDRLSATIKAQYFDLLGAPISQVMEGTVSETRVAVEVEPAGE